jgi:D-alanyl-D-alanine carboxypeptidase/D-alanyl-D-alanine-endopeptidase (penicillin-binding protein 4)
MKSAVAVLIFGIATAGAAQTMAPPAPATPATAAQPTSSSAPLAQRLDAIFNAPQWSSAHWGVLVKDLDTSTVLYEHEAGKSVMPASNMKLFTTAASLATLGADYRFETKIYATGTTDTAGTLHGNIFIVGSGDPSISGRYLDTPTTAILARWADAITSAGIKRIEGDIIGDDDIFDESYIAGSWQYDYLSEWYAAENSGLAINDNCWDMTFYPYLVDWSRMPARAAFKQKAETRLQLSTADPLRTDYYNFSTDIKSTTSSEGGDNSSIEIKRLPESNNISLKGSIVVDTSSANSTEGWYQASDGRRILDRFTPIHEWGSIHNGTLFTVTLLKEELDRRSIKVSGKPTDIDNMDRQMATWLKTNPGQLIHTHVSPPLSKILAIVNKPSQNFYADMLLKVIGAKAHGLGSWNNGEKVVKDVLTTAGADTRSLNMADGSGLSRRNLVEPRQVVALLTYMHSRPDFPVFEASLPIMGIDGTLKGRMTGTAAEGNVHAKTGTIGGVRSLSGYGTAQNGHRIVFCMIANNFYLPTSAATDAQNRAVLELINQ